MVQTRPDVKDQLKKLKKISYNNIKNRSAGVVDVLIKELSHKDLGRALYVSTSAFAELSQKQIDIKKVLEDPNITIERIKELVLDLKVEHSLESSSGVGKES